MFPAQMKRTWARIIKQNILCSFWVLHSWTQADEWATEMRIMLSVNINITYLFRCYLKLETFSLYPPETIADTHNDA